MRQNKIEHFTLASCKRIAKINYYQTLWEETVTMATILVLKYSTTSELSIFLLGTFLKYKLFKHCAQNTHQLKG